MFALGFYDWRYFNFDDFCENICQKRTKITFLCRMDFGFVVSDFDVVEVDTYIAGKAWYNMNHVSDHMPVGRINERPWDERWITAHSCEMTSLRICLILWV